ncbi:hypothetical protein LRP76_29520, partial [Burkholderia pseudomallei]|nr:hypothetical protein [Burkholderia pseudomallei]
MSENVMANSKENTEAAAAPQDARRRRFLASSAVAGLAGASLSLGLAFLGGVAVACAGFKYFQLMRKG